MASSDALTAEAACLAGYRFYDPALLARALTHGSAVKRGQAHESNERLEFLGDRVLGLIVADMLYRALPHEAEGALSKRHAGLVRRETLADLAQALDLGPRLHLARAEEDNGGRSNPSLLADAFEAVLGAIYLDGGYAAADAVLRPLIGPRLHDMSAPPRDAKTRLQEWAQARGHELPLYETVGQDGPPHAPTFAVTVCVAPHRPATGQGSSKQQAQQAAARALLERLEVA